MGCTFSRWYPASFATLSLAGVNYRNMTLDLQLQGHGTKLKSFKIDGTVQEQAFVPTDLTGHHSIVMELN